MPGAKVRPAVFHPLSGPIAFVTVSRFGTFESLRKNDAPLNVLPSHTFTVVQKDNGEYHPTKCEKQLLGVIVHKGPYILGGHCVAYVTTEN